MNVEPELKQCVETVTADERFLQYVSAYDRSDGMIELKIVHTIKVAEVMDQLTMGLKLGKEMRKLAHICAMYHDIGRFEQVKRYHTFLDQKSVDHADFGCEILKQENLLSFLEEEEQEMILTAIHNHNKYRIEDGVEGDTRLLCELIRDADKCDIFRVFACEELIDTMGATMEMVEQETVTKEVFESFMKHQSIEKSIRRTGLDKWIGFLGFFFDIYFDESIRLLMKDKYYRVQFDRARFTDPETEKTVGLILEDLEEYLSHRKGALPWGI